MYGFEFGNELPNVDPVVMGNDYLRLRALINKYALQEVAEAVTSMGRLAQYATA